MPLDRDLIGTWLTGWARARKVGAPVAQGDCWQVEIGWPSQARRFVFPLPSPQLSRLAQTITDPLVYLKAFQPAGAMQAQLPPGWVLEPQCAMMLLDVPDAPVQACPDGYRLQQDGSSARILAGDAIVASGQVVIENGLAVFVGIKVDAAHRRRGLGRIVMAALTAMARDAGVRQGALVATPEGQALYRALGWREYAPYISAHPHDPIAP